MGNEDSSFGKDPIQLSTHTRREKEEFYAGTGMEGVAIATSSFRHTHCKMQVAPTVFVIHVFQIPSAQVLICVVSF